MSRHRARDLILFAVATAFTLVAAAPLIWMTLGAFKTIAEIISIPPVWIPDFTYLNNFTDLFENYWPYMLNSLLATLGATALALALALPTAFGLVNFKMRGKNALADWILSTRMMPPIAAAVPLFIIFKGIGLLDSVWALVIAYAGFNLPFAVWVAMSFLRRVPREVLEAARLDGCSWWQTLVRVALPMSRSGIMTVATFVFIFSWNEFMLALFLTSRTARTFPVVISSFVSTGKVYWEYLSASAIIQCLPPIVFTLLMQRHIVSGMTMGAMKE
jgi:ABC-type glycerol-3-phosphate transport system permease component